jgi:hypothetical protein
MVTPNKYLILGAVVAGLGVAYMLKKGATAAVQAINPLDRDNIINQGATSLYQAVTGSSGTIGGDFYDATHGGALDATSGNNAIYSGISNIGASVTGEKGWTLGGQIYDWTH